MMAEKQNLEEEKKKTKIEEEKNGKSGCNANISNEHHIWRLGYLETNCDERKSNRPNGFWFMGFSTQPLLSQSIFPHQRIIPFHQIFVTTNLQ